MDQTTKGWKDVDVDCRRSAAEDRDCLVCVTLPRQVTVGVLAFKNSFGLHSPSSCLGPFGRKLPWAPEFVVARRWAPGAVATVEQGRHSTTCKSTQTFAAKSQVRPRHRAARPGKDSASRRETVALGGCLYIPLLLKTGSCRVRFEKVRQADDSSRGLGLVGSQDVEELGDQLGCS